MKQLLYDLFCIIATTLAALLFIPLTFIFAIYAACREYSKYLCRLMVIGEQDEEYKHEQIHTW